MVATMNKDTGGYKAAEKVNRKKMDASSQLLLLLLLLFIIIFLEQVTKIVVRGFYLA